MAAVTDLTWDQIANVFGGSIFIVIPPDAYHPDPRLMLDVSAVSGQVVSGSGQTGVIAAMLRLHEACATAQSDANTGKATGEKLANFGITNYGTPVSNTVKATVAMAAQIKVVPLGSNQISAINV